MNFLMAFHGEDSESSFFLQFCSFRCWYSAASFYAKKVRVGSFSTSLLSTLGLLHCNRVGHIFPPIFFLPAVFPPKFSSWQVILLGLDTPRHYFTLDNSLLLIIHPSLGFPKSQLPNILLWLYSPRHLYSRHIVYPESFPPRIKTSQQQILLAFNSPSR